MQAIVQELWGLYVTALDVKVPAEKNAKNGVQPDGSGIHDGGDEVSRTLLTSPLHDEPIHVGSSSPAPENGREHDAGRKYRSDISELKKYPPLLLSPLFSYLAILVLKLPITLSDIYLYHLKRHSLL